MARVDMVQGSEEWLQWRQGEGGIPTIGGSVLGTLLEGAKKAPFEKETLTTKVCVSLGFLPRGIPSPRMDRGTRLEPFCRDHAEAYFGCQWEPSCHTSDHHPLLRVSTDGENDTRHQLWECKCPLYTDEMRIMGEVPSVLRYVRDKRIIPDWYMPQAQGELMASERGSLNFCAYLVDDWSDPYKAVILDWDFIPVPRLPAWGKRIIAGLEQWRIAWERTHASKTMVGQLAHWVAGWGLPADHPIHPETGEVVSLDTLKEYLQ